MSQKFTSQVVAGVAGVGVMALICAAALHLGADGPVAAQTLDNSRLWRQAQSRNSPPNPYGVLVNPGFVSDAGLTG